ncbi:hypothetical protein HDU92_003407 [Lobulomyces angularis]|nr:hypothetical protein HDU92_003407 [Lobulomyces angularis]
MNFFQHPFTSNTLNIIKLNAENLLYSPSKNFKFKLQKDFKKAAILVPLCNVNNKPSILFTIRSSNLRDHSGEVSFPGGKVDINESVEEAALRETEEEILIPKRNVQVLGRLSSLPSLNKKLEVFPVIGFLDYIVNTEHFNKDEVSTVFTMALEDLLDKKNRELQKFRETEIIIPSWKCPLEIQKKYGSEIRIWGLTAFVLHNFFLNVLIRDEKIYQRC